TKPKDRHKHQYIYYPTTPIIQSLDRSLNLRSSTRFFRIPTEEPPSSKKCKFFKNSPKKTANIGNNNASSENPFDSRGSPPDAQAQKAKKAFVKKALSEKGSPSVADPSKIITEEKRVNF
uniref:Uncharacterized protein n=1 Tax=Romanomermis culicivorax TaxID=13658 RepID=A0A915ITG7_ROMCU